MNPLNHHATLSSLPLVHRGKVRDVYAVGDEHLLIIATDRLSAFDVVMPTALPGKGQLLTKMALFWFAHFAEIPNHLSTTLHLEDVLPDPQERAQAQGRCMLVQRLQALPVEAVVRGYLIGSGWKDYQATGAVCGHTLAANLPLAAQLPEPLFTPASKAAVGDHDENIDFDAVVAAVGRDHAEHMRRLSLDIYQRAAQYARPRGLIIADTKFEFGLNKAGDLILMDEILTPDSSRFWEASSWREGHNPHSYDKQFMRDYLVSLPDWNREPPGPEIPSEITSATLARYREALTRLSS